METSKILIPSFEVERRTQALSKSLWGFVGVISMFTVGVGVFVSHEMFVSVLNITSTFMSEHMILAGLVPIVCFALIFGIGLYHFLNSLLHSYEISNEKIVKGRIMRLNKVGRLSVDLEPAFVAYMAANMGNGSKVSNANGIKNMLSILELISYNMEQSFVDEFFHTDMYKKKEYSNPKLIKETKYYYIYSCDDKKRVKIHKIYTGMCGTDNGKRQPSMVRRIITKSVLVMLAFALLSTADLAIGATNNEENIGNIQQTVSEIQRSLDTFGYTANKYSEKTYRFEKIVSSERTSYIKYSFNVKGQIEDAEFEVYYNSNSEDMRSELEYIITSTTGNFSDAEILAFIENVRRTMDGEFSYDKLESSKCNIILGTSGGYAHIHN